MRNRRATRLRGGDSSRRPRTQAAIVHAEASSPARSGSFNQYRQDYRAPAKAPAESISPVKADEAAPVKQSAPALPRDRINA